MEKSYGEWQLKDLRAELRRRNARVSGRKAELVERLEAYDRNSDFGRTDYVQAEFEMDVPPPTSFKDLHAGMAVPDVTPELVDTYLAQSDKKLDSKAVALYENNFINFVRRSECDDHIYFKAECRAEMKVNSTYMVDICLTPSGVIYQCQCECAAGMGPHAHCKHVCCVLYGLACFKDTQQFKTLTTCTGQLQTFHQAKKHLGSPVKASNLPVHVAANVDFDPRPPEFRGSKAYPTLFRTVMLNSGDFAEAPILQIYPPANPYAMAHDHDYCFKSPEEQFLEQFELSCISDERVIDIQASTTDNKCAWVQERAKRICSSHFGEICCMTERCNKERVVQNLLNHKDFKSKATRHGNMYESVAVKTYEVNNGIDTKPCGLFVSLEKPFLASTPDRVVSQDKLLEIKCPFTAKDRKISPESVPYLQMRDGELALKPSHQYHFQVQGQMYCTGATSVDFVVFTHVDMVTIHVRRDNNFIAQMVEKLDTFHKDFHRKAILEKYFYRNFSSHFECK